MEILVGNILYLTNILKIEDEVVTKAYVILEEFQKAQEIYLYYKQNFLEIFS
jgi:hypothetical protein